MRLMMSRLPNALAFTKSAIAALALGATSLAGASTLPTFSFNPSAVGLAGPAFSADSLLVRDNAAVFFNPGNHFSESGYLIVTGALQGSNLAVTPGLGVDYGLYIQFSATGTVIFGADPTTGPTLGTLDSLTFTLYGYNGPATFGFSGPIPVTTAANSIPLISGSLVTGSVSTAVSPPSFAPSAQATLSVNAPLEPGFFVLPSPFYRLAQTSFSNTSSQVTLFNGGFMVQQGGGSLNFAAAVPEPGSYALLASGLALIGPLARRRRRER